LEIQIWFKIIKENTRIRSSYLVEDMEELVARLEATVSKLEFIGSEVGVVSSPSASSSAR
jgi:hypothetical protein